MNDQAYFWTYDWQRDEAESLADLRAGHARTFDNPQDAMAWLETPLTHRFCDWNATPDLAQAAWKWPSYANYASCDGSYPSLKRPAEGLWHAIEREVKAADLDWERYGRQQWTRQLYRA